MITISVKNGRVESIESDGKPVMEELYGLHYEHAREVPELEEACERYEEENPLEKAKAVLRKYKEGTNPVIENCPRCMVRR